ncbi:hypothetical protein EBL_c31070 [Shimwellia blattae DSM 4481 = NBRC 105725]|uniref:Uncharacterized protein n=1 Tax=Shimwellia blattae (strain ATCC 29907 / DSM 4481 / JCM 1650 / NBRC 105725 / CDC 9005-74) TaxID=630626 RepID=I2BCC3_SHIBC|nr:hypothetical protein EBL_c31070 [Shimwellia blattae DSM 4481 = NBRC 105725]
MLSKRKRKTISEFIRKYLIRIQSETDPAEMDSEMIIWLIIFSVFMVFRK